VTYSNATDVLGISCLNASKASPSGRARRAGSGSTEHGRHRILGASGTAAGRAMYKLGGDDTLSHDAMGATADLAAPFCMGGANLFSTADTSEICADAARRREVDGVRVLSEESWG